MKPLQSACAYLFYVSVSIMLSVPVIAQEESNRPQVTNPFDSLTINDIRAIGNPATGSVQVTMQVHSDNHKLAKLDFGGGTFGDFGVTDDKGIQYKYSSSEGPGGINAGVNKGYGRIADLLFGQSKVGMLISVQDTLYPGVSKSLAFRLNKVDKSTRLIRETHILSTLMLSGMFAGQKAWTIKNIPIEWIQPKKADDVKKRQ